MKYYDLLDLPPTATPEQIKAAYRILVQLHHPDRLLQANDNVRQYAQEKLKQINEAYKVLSDPTRRAAYDARHARRRVENDDAAAEDDSLTRRPRPRRPKTEAELNREAEDLLRRHAEREAAEREAERARQRAAAEERARRDAAERQRRAAQHQYPRAQTTAQGLTAHFAPGLWMSLIPIPAGDFRMGSDPARDPNAQTQEQPQHLVSLPDYAIGQYPITNAHYQVFARAAQRPFEFLAGREHHPAVNVAWDDAVAFCVWLSRLTGRTFRLPSEAEWEKAARGPDGRLFPWGDAWDDTRLNAAQPHLGTTPVGQFSPLGDSPYGVADLSGNVWEWCADWFDARHYARRAQRGRPVRRPLGPAAGAGCVARGGAFDSPARQARAAYRNWFYPYNTRPNLGFRIVAEFA
jgi:formylglycine-generating enzyme required for sulfatase activity